MVMKRRAGLLHLLALCVGLIVGYTWVTAAFGPSNRSFAHLSTKGGAHVVHKVGYHKDFFPQSSGQDLTLKEEGQKNTHQGLQGEGDGGNTKSEESTSSSKDQEKVTDKKKKKRLFSNLSSIVSKKPRKPKSSGKYHMVVTADQHVYNAWQVQVCYHWYKKMKEEYPESDLGGFTRLLHTGQPDELMDVIPTVVVDPEPPEKERGYKVLNRPWAFQQFLEKTNISEEYIFMSEPDHLMLKPMPNWATPTKAAAFPFHYMKAQDDPKHPPIIAHFNKKNVPLDKIFPTGNSPVIISKQQMKNLAPLWRQLAFEIDTYEPSKKYWGWVLEMWAFTISCSQQEPPIEFELHPEFMLQPPWDKVPQVNVCNDDGSKCGMKDGFILHYTYGVDFDDDGESIYGKQDEHGRIVLGTWRFDKREFTQKYPTLETVPLPSHPNIKENHPLTYTLVEMIRDAIPDMKDTARRPT